MLSRSFGALRRLQAMLVGLGLLTVTGPLSPSLAHEGHDHGAPPAADVTTSNPRVAAQSDAYELVGILRGGRLGVYLDRFATNEPVTDAKLTVTVGGDEEVQAEKGADDTYAVASGKFAGEGPLELIFAISAPSGDDLLIGTLQLAQKAAAAAPAPQRPFALQSLQSLPAFRIGNADIPGALPDRRACARARVPARPRRPRAAQARPSDRACLPRPGRLHRLCPEPRGRGSFGRRRQGGSPGRRHAAPAARRNGVRAEAQPAAPRGAHHPDQGGGGAEGHQPDRAGHRRPEPKRPCPEHQRRSGERPRDGTASPRPAGPQRATSWR